MSERLLLISSALDVCSTWELIRGNCERRECAEIVLLGCPLFSVLFGEAREYEADSADRADSKVALIWELQRESSLMED